jgi:malate dehydrogenase (oxaloacetate-decarboxylating)(NADP+)
MADSFDDAALEYHRQPKPGKLEITATKPLANQRDLALAYSPGVAAACRVIVADPREVATVTGRSNLVAVITNGTAVLGLGNIGPLAAKPVMEGKAVLFKKFADIDVFDIEINESDPAKLVEIIASLEPTFGGINLEDIKAPECFEVERKLRGRMGIPVFHDDQHGTAIIVGAAVKNGLRVVGKKIEEVNVVSTGGGAAGIACLNLLVDMGLKRERVTLVDRVGVVYKGRTEEMDPQKAAYAQDTNARRLEDVIDGADIFLGLSAPGILTKDMVKRMGRAPLILALANPTPEIMPDEAREAAPDAVIATGRSDFPNQVNNVLCFPFIFRGALDVGATTINEEMKLAASSAIADLAMAESSEIVAQAYGTEDMGFGRDYLIPKPFDPRLIVEIAPAVAEAAMKSGVATRPIADLDAYREQLSRFVFKSGMLMRPVFTAARQARKRVVYAGGEDRRVLRAIQGVVDEELAQPILIGRAAVVANRIEQLGLRIKAGQDFELVDPENDPRYNTYWRYYHGLMERKGITPDDARTVVRTNTTAIASLLVAQGDADAMLCGSAGHYDWHLKQVIDILGLAPGVQQPAALSVLILPKGTYFLCDTHVMQDPTAEQMVEMTVLAAEAVRRFGAVPRVAVLSHSNFGTVNSPSAVKARRAVELLRARVPDLEVEGEMQVDVAFNAELRGRIFPNARLTGEPNLMIFPTLEAANTAETILKTLADGLLVGPILLGAARAAHVLTPSITSRGIINMTALAAVDAQSRG